MEVNFTEVGVAKGGANSSEDHLRDPEADRKD